eukprot:TCONS_00001786-protein
MNKILTHRFVIWFLMLYPAYITIARGTRTKDRTRRTETRGISDAYGKLCTNKTKFEETLASNHLYDGKKYKFEETQLFLNETNRQCASISQSTCKLKIQWSLQDDEKTGKEFYQISYSLQSIDCWKVGVVVETDDQTAKQIKFNSNKDGDLKINFILSFRYQISIVPLPSGEIYQELFIAPTICELEAIYDILEKAGPEIQECSAKLSYKRILKEARVFCGNNTIPKEHRRSKIRNELHITEQCTIVYDEDYDMKDNKINVLMVYLIVAILFVIVMLGGCIWFLKRKKSTSDQQQKLFGKGLQDHQISEKGIISVMVVHRPGCEYLDNLVQQFSSMLKSYGVNVHVTFEVDDLSAEGGIASYLQRYMQICDYVIMFVTDNHKDKNILLKHRPYEFGLRILEGMALHETTNHQAQFIPVYIIKYRKAVQMFPTFLIQSNAGYGFQLPKQANDLIRRLRQTKTKSKDQSIKDGLFITEMGDLSKQFLMQQHSDCNSEHCHKGMRHTSTANLSSVWATTVHSEKNRHRKSSRDSHVFDEDEEEDYDQLLLKEKEMSDIQYQKTKAYLQMMSHESQATDQTDITSLDSIGDTESLSPNHLKKTYQEHCVRDGYKRTSRSSDEVFCDQQHRLLRGEDCSFDTTTQC